jgi:hypothetical protein
MHARQHEGAAWVLRPPFDPHIDREPRVLCIERRLDRPAFYVVAPSMSSAYV